MKTVYESRSGWSLNQSYSAKNFSIDKSIKPGCAGFFVPEEAIKAIADAAGYEVTLTEKCDDMTEQNSEIDTEVADLRVVNMYDGEELTFVHWPDGSHFSIVSNFGDDVAAFDESEAVNVARFLLESSGYEWKELRKAVRTMEHRGERFWHSDDVKPCREDAEHGTRSHRPPQVVVPSPNTSSGIAFIGYHGVRGWWRPFYTRATPHALKQGDNDE